MTEELRGVREQLANIQTDKKTPEKAKLTDHIKGLEEKIGKLSAQIGKIKDHLLGTVSEAMKAFRDSGKQEMNKVICKGISGVQNLVSATRDKLEEVRLDFEKTSNQIDSIGDELKQIGNSAANVGRLLSGKGTQEISEDKPGVAVTRAVNMPVKKMLHKLNKGIEQLEQKTEKFEELAKKFEPKEKVSLSELGNGSAEED